MKTTDLIPIILYQLKDQEKYGLEIVDAISQCSNGRIDIKQTTLYPLLKKLEKSKFISSYWQDSDIGGKRHYYKITTNGLAQLETYPSIDELINNIFLESENVSETPNETPPSETIMQSETLSKDENETKIYSQTIDYSENEMDNELEADEILKKLSNVFKIEDVSKKEKKRQSKPPFITSTLQQEASTKLGFTAKKTMSLAQKLYEGVDLQDETVGLITYMRTDSIRLSDEFVKSAYKFIETKYGTEYLGVVKKSKKTENVQDAHEAIRPTSITRTPEAVKPYLSNDEFKLYSMIYKRALSSLMKDAKEEVTSVVLDNNDYKFKTTGSVIKFDGYLKVQGDYEDKDIKLLPPFDKYKTNVLVSNEIIKEQHFTKPKPRYTEAKLIKEMEDLGIGRPSTYAKTMENIVDRGYVKVEDKNKKVVPGSNAFVPSSCGHLIAKTVFFNLMEE